MPRILRNLKINEISGVDKGAGRGVKIMLMKRAADDDEIDWDVLKREFSSKERDAAASSGAALPDGSYPIKTKSDLKNAIQAIGRAKNPAKAKAHIKSRARALGASGLIPDTWKRDTDAAVHALSESIASIAGDNAIEDKVGKIDESISQFNEFVSQESTDMTAEEIRKMLDEAVAKAVEPLHAEIEKLGGDGSKMKAKKPPPDADGDDDGDGDGPAKKWKKPTHDSTNNPGAEANSQPSSGKSSNKRDNTEETEIEKALSAERARTTELEKHLGVLLNERRQAEFRKRAVEAGLTENDGEVMRKAFDGDLEAQTEFTKRTAETIKAARAQVKTSVLFGQFGKSGQDAPASAYAEIEVRAAELRKAEPKLSQHQAFAKVYSDPANSELVERDRTEQAQKRARLAAGM